MTMVPIGSFDGNAISGNVTFSNIPQIYKHLRVKVSARTIRSFTLESIYIRLNNDAGSNYVNHYNYGVGVSGINAGYVASTTVLTLASITGASATSGLYGVSVNDIMDYTSTIKNKVCMSFGGVDLNGLDGFIGTYSGLWLNTAAITSLTVVSNGAWDIGTKVDLYGVL